MFIYYAWYSRMGEKSRTKGPDTLPLVAVSSLSWIFHWLITESSTYPLFPWMIQIENGVLILEKTKPNLSKKEFRQPTYNMFSVRVRA